MDEGRNINSADTLSIRTTASPQSAPETDMMFDMSNSLFCCAFSGTLWFDFHEC